jgi:hypothetical protein
MPHSDICLDELTLEELDVMPLNGVSAVDLHHLPLECRPEGPEFGEWDDYSGSASGMGLGMN